MNLKIKPNILQDSWIDYKSIAFHGDGEHQNKYPKSRRMETRRKQGFAKTEREECAYIFLFSFL